MLKKLEGLVGKDQKITNIRFDFETNERCSAGMVMPTEPCMKKYKSIYAKKYFSS